MAKRDDRVTQSHSIEEAEVRHERKLKAKHSLARERPVRQKRKRPDPRIANATRAT